MNKYQISPSLYNAWRYYTETDFEKIYNRESAKNPFGTPERVVEAEEKARQDLLDYLNRVPKEISPEMQDGIDFENLVCRIADGTQTEEDCQNSKFESASRVAQKVKGAFRQVHLTMSLDGHILHGYADFIKEDTIIDTKFSKSYDIGKYWKSIQHLIYLHASEVENFDYLISNGRTEFLESYTKTDNTLNLLRGRVLQMVAWLESNAEFAEPFVKNFLINKGK